MAPPLLFNQPHSIEAGSIQAEMKTRLSNNHPLFQNDNTFFYGIFWEAVCGDIYDATIKPFQRTHDLLEDYKALMGQHAGKDKWIFVLRDENSYVNSRKWNRNTSFTLQNHVERCRSAYVDIETSVMHVPEKSPTSVLEFRVCLTLSMLAWIRRFVRRLQQ